MKLQYYLKQHSHSIGRLSYIGIIRSLGRRFVYAARVISGISKPSTNTRSEIDESRNGFTPSRHHAATTVLLHDIPDFWRSRSSPGQPDLIGKPWPRRTLPARGFRWQIISRSSQPQAITYFALSLRNVPLGLKCFFASWSGSRYLLPAARRVRTSTAKLHSGSWIPTPATR